MEILKLKGILKVGQETICGFSKHVFNLSGNQNIQVT